MADVQRKVTASEQGQRLDQLLATWLPEHSRARLQRWIRDGQVAVDGEHCKPGTRLTAGQTVAVRAPAADTAAAEGGPRAQDLGIHPVFADEHVIVIDKPAGLVVHPAAGNPDGTLLNGLLYLDENLASLPRGGIVHRLDKDTTGLMVVARSPTAHTALVRQLQARSVSRHYQALVYGALISGGSVDQPIGRHPADRKKMAVREGGRSAVTHYRVAQRFRDLTLLDVQLETGRTHQIRVHLSHLGFPLVGDPIYGRRRHLPTDTGDAAKRALAEFSRQALHAARLAFDHPADGRRMVFTAELPADLHGLLQTLTDDPAQSRRPAS